MLDRGDGYECRVNGFFRNAVSELADIFKHEHGY